MLKYTGKDSGFKGMLISFILGAAAVGHYTLLSNCNGYDEKRE
jgi:hypothetical protein